MLLELNAVNVGVIKEINWRLAGGLNVITGETGAGKSLVIDAVELLLTGKLSEDVIRYGEEEARIEGIFALPGGDDSSPLRALLEQKNITSVDDRDSLVITCRLRRNTPGVVRVNGQAVPRSLLRQIGKLLVDIHGQSEHLSLLDVKNHLDYLDAYAGVMELRDGFSNRAARLYRASVELEELKAGEQEYLNRNELLSFQVDEISRAELREGEEEQLEAEKNILTSAEKLKELAQEAYRTLYESDASGQSPPALDRLNEALQAVRELADLDNEQKPLADLLDEAVCSLTELSRDLRAYGDGVEYNPARLEEIETRLELIRGLKRKYGATITEVLNYMAKAQGELEATGNSAERRTRLEEECQALQREMGEIAARLSRERSRAVERLNAAVKRELEGLNMSRVDFDVAVMRNPDPAGIPLPDGECYAFSNNGIDNVEFMAATNPGEPLKPLARIASTGELSRFTLALKAVLAGSYGTPVVIFDEIDIGIGGRSGEIIGRKLWALSRSCQIICVTHLPQIAVFADAHFSIHKEILDAHASSVLEGLDPDARIRELAGMLSGLQYTETALKNARELLRKADEWKQSRADTN